jgi:hypothetical protein
MGFMHTAASVSSPTSPALSATEQFIWRFLPFGDVVSLVISNRIVDGCHNTYRPFGLSTDHIARIQDASDLGGVSEV